LSSAVWQKDVTDKKRSKVASTQVNPNLEWMSFCRRQNMLSLWQKCKKKSMLGKGKNHDKSVSYWKKRICQNDLIK